MIDFGTCLKCGSRAVVCKCMLEKTEAHAEDAQRQQAEAPQPRSPFIALQMRQAGWHNDVHAYTDAFMRGGFNSAEASIFFKQGRKEKADGMPCSCKACCAVRRAHRDAGAGI